RQYSSNQYKWPCDFYIKSLDLFIEYQGSWVHGNQPFDSSNSIHQRIIRKWQEKGTEYFNYAIKIWTIRDPEKRRVAKENNLNFKELWSLKEAREFINSLNNSD
ncbi:MAG: hypothetical protein IJH34_01005, partial [Romboutsia sp.]|nr:hypothetical protein [Romboutsia sp.]